MVRNKSSGLNAKSKPTMDNGEISLLTSRLLDLCSKKLATPTPISVLLSDYAEIRESVDKIRNAQKDMSEWIFSIKEDSSRQKPLEAMDEWCRKNGVKADGVRFVPTDESERDFGMTVDKDFSEGSTIVTVPASLFLSYENWLRRNSGWTGVFNKDPLLNGMPNVALTLMIVIEKLKGSDSHWAVYLNSLPEKYPLPLFALFEDGGRITEVLRGSIALEETLKLFRNLVRQYSYFHQMMHSSNTAYANISGFPKGQFLFDLYVWAAATVMTRINFVPSSTCETGGANKPMPALIPFFDMANHGDVQPCTDFLDERHSAVIYAGKSYQAGDKLLINYGRRAFWEFYVHNGFVNTAGASYPNVQIRVGLSSSDALLPLKQSVLRKLRLDPATPFVISMEQQSLDDLRRFALVFCAGEAELKAIDQLPEIDSDTDRSVLFAAAATLWLPETVEKARIFLHTRLALLARSYAVANDNRRPPDEAQSTTSAGVDLAQRFVRAEMDVYEEAMRRLAS